ncbi:MAG TPA: hypothetical protein VE174_07025 [Actinomycetota bacterium]|nr:hypothetical protein [Actinomycetota bacterium]
MRTPPEPGPYGPVPWSHPRPWALWAFVALYVVASLYYAIFIWGGSTNILGWVPGVAATYLALRGSKIAWVVSIVLAGLGLLSSAGQVQEARAPGGHAPVLHIIETGFLFAMLVLLLLPQTRRFYDLEARRALRA